MKEITAPFYCENCLKETIHSVIKERKFKKGLMVEVKCSICGKVHQILENDNDKHEIQMMVSYRDETKKFTYAINKYETVNIDDVISIDNSNVKVTKIENRDRKSVRKAKALDILSIWAINYDKVPVKFSISSHGYTESRTIEVKPDELFTVGDKINLFGKAVVIFGMNINGYVAKTGSAYAYEIKRIYTKYPMRKSYYR